VRKRMGEAAGLTNAFGAGGETAETITGWLKGDAGNGAGLALGREEVESMGMIADKQCYFCLFVGRRP